MHWGKQEDHKPHSLFVEGNKCLSIRFLQEVCQAKHPTEASSSFDLRYNLSFVLVINDRSEGKDGGERDGLEEC